MRQGPPEQLIRKCPIPRRLFPLLSHRMARLATTVSWAYWQTWMAPLYALVYHGVYGAVQTLAEGTLLL